MKWYIVVEGRRTEKKVYKAWLGHAFPDIAPAARIEDMDENRYFIISGGGYPSYVDRIQQAIEDIRAKESVFDHLMVAVDAEQTPVEERRRDIEELIADASCPIPHTVIVHNCCIETWFLGNRKLARRNPHGEELRRFYEFFDVRTDDPEEMPSIDERTRAQFHLAYLRELFREHGLSYSKQRPGAVCERPYLEALASRVAETEHLDSLRILLQCWREHGGML